MLLKDVRTLIVEDEMDLLVLLREEFESHGADVFTASNNKDGQTIIDSIKPVVILVDSRMPGESGVDLIRKIRKIENYNPNVFLLSAYSDLSRNDAEELNVCLIKKPLDLTNLISFIAEKLGPAVH